jgi:peptidoglycan/xylan/chitin deacetylase (PgdA/CDA1 family)
MQRTPGILIVIATLALIVSSETFAEIITRLPTGASGEKVVALTFDACETKTPSYFDRKILDYLLREKIPFTLFPSKAFVERNRAEIIELSKLWFVEVENHSVSHVLHMEGLSDDEVLREIDPGFIEGVTGRKPRFFRFPGGNFDERTLRLVEGAGYRVVHWRFPSGDPDKNVTPERLTQHVLSKTRSGDILIFHINGRGYSTGEALPAIIEGLRKRGFMFVRLEEGL